MLNCDQTSILSDAARVVRWLGRKPVQLIKVDCSIGTSFNLIQSSVINKAVEAVVFN